MIRGLDGKFPKIHPTVFVSEAAYIVGDVTIGEGSSVWPGAVIRADYGDIIIGQNCSLQDNCTLHTDDHLELGDNVLLTHGAGRPRRQGRPQRPDWRQRRVAGGRRRRRLRIHRRRRHRPRPRPVPLPGHRRPGAKSAP